MQSLNRQTDKRRTQTDRILLVVAVGVIAVMMFVLNRNTPMLMDDYDYAFNWSTGNRLESPAAIVGSQMAHYRLWGGRVIVHGIAQFFLQMSKGVFDVANTLCYILLLAEMTWIAGVGKKSKGWLFLLMVHSILMAGTPFFGVVFLWLDGACNYLWGTVLALIPLLVIKKIYIEEQHVGTKTMAALLPLGILCGWTNENTACGMLALTLLVNAEIYRKQKTISKPMAVLWVSQLIGVGLMLLAPGNFVRASAHGQITGIWEIPYRIVVITWVFLRSTWIPMAGIVLLALTGYAKPSSESQKTWMICLGIGIAASTYALAVSPEISDRAMTGPMVLSICLFLNVLQNWMEQNGKKFCTLMAAVCVAGIVGTFTDASVSTYTRGEMWEKQQRKMIESAELGEDQVKVSGVPASRFFRGMELAAEADQWPNSTLSKYYGVQVLRDNAEVSSDCSTQITDDETD